MNAVDADVIVVGAGPAGSATAFYLAQAGLDVLLLEKTRFPREKVCGDGLTPRAVKQLMNMGVDIDAPGWVRNKGLRVVGGGGRYDLDWPQLDSFPDFGLVRTRQDFDQVVAATAVKAGARLMEGVNVTGAILDDRSGHIVGVTTKDGASYRSRVVVAADGNSTRLALAMGLYKREDRPMGVAVRTYFESPRHDDDYLEIWLELWDEETLLPGYGWVFGVGDGTSNVGLGLLNTSDAFKNIDYRDLLKRWTRNMPGEWGFTAENMTTPIRGAALPMAFNRQPHYTRGPGARGRLGWRDQPVQR
ncbi:geranylgeranyl reductase family protein [Nonomuraea dietziae]|uniref:Geranylgeranyl reductase family protein n=1 Tax=Nonomuraea dietziae TaxID=65515 RepID=A0A7W5YCC0_9ACTN|nr:geranylgeranyl reductase family protein [Nonomuraea dietziae]